MSYQIIQQPDGKYAVWSSIVDDFVLGKAVPKDIIEFYLTKERSSIERRVNSVIQELKDGGKPYFQFTKTWSEAQAKSKIPEIKEM